MSKEIERRFLVVGEGWREAPSFLFSQAYLHAEKQCTVRVRLAAGPDGEHAWLTVKGASSHDGTSRDEFEYSIPPADARTLIAMASCGKVEKNRHIVTVDGLRWEVDAFLGDNAGLVLAEIELDDPDQPFSKPGWLGREVTADARYTSARLAACPYNQWGGGAPDETG